MAGVAHAQDAPPPAYFAVVDGAATIERDGQADAAVQNMPFVPGDRLRTTTGRVEILFPDGSGLDVDEYSSVDLDSPIRFTIAEGRAIFVVRRDVQAYATRYEINTPSDSFVTAGAGTYRIDAAAPDVHAFSAAFERWSDARQAERTAAASSQYLPQDLQTYGSTFDRYGSWEYSAPYGYVWYPTVAPDWRPYYYGYWAPVRPYGWTWIGLDLWAWPTHHFGRWGFSRARWFWIPGRTFGPAWVSWSAAPGYVGWCPLGFDDTAVFALSVSYRRGLNGWTVLPRSYFGRRDLYLHNYAVAPHHLPHDAAFITQSVPPVAVPRANIAAAAVSGGVAVPRAGSRQWATGPRRAAADVRTPPDAEPRPPNAERRANSDDRRLGNDEAPHRLPLPHAVPRDRVQPTNDYRPPRFERRPAEEYRSPAFSRRPPNGEYRSPALDERRTTNDERRTWNGERRTTNDERPTTNNHAVPRWSVPQMPHVVMPSAPAPSRAPTPSMQPPATGVPAMPRVAPDAPPAIPRMPTWVAPSVAAPRVMTPPAPAAAPPPPSAPPPSYAPPQRSAPAGAAPAGTAVPRSAGEGQQRGQGGGHRRE